MRSATIAADIPTSGSPPPGWAEPAHQEETRDRRCGSAARMKAARRHRCWTSRRCEPPGDARGALEVGRCPGLGPQQAGADVVSAFRKHVEDAFPIPLGQSGVTPVDSSWRGRGAGH